MGWDSWGPCGRGRKAANLQGEQEETVRVVYPATFPCRALPNCQAFPITSCQGFVHKQRSHRMWRLLQLFSRGANVSLSWIPNKPTVSKLQSGLSRKSLNKLCSSALIARCFVSAWRTEHLHFKNKQSNLLAKIHMQLRLLQQFKNASFCLFILQDY